jgi:hypothetical protein
VELNQTNSASTYTVAKHVENLSKKPNPSKELFSMPEDMADIINNIRRRLTDLEKRVSELEDAIFEDEKEGEEE